jgi:hypothetical protein
VTQAADMRFVRVFLNDPEDADWPFVVDLVVGDEGSVNGKIPTFGRWGKLNSNAVWPFILLTDGRMDFGETPEDALKEEDRYGWTNIFSKQIRVGEYVTFRAYGDEYCLPITRVTDLLADLSPLP